MEGNAIFVSGFLITLLSIAFGAKADVISNEEEWKLRNLLFTNYNKSQRPSQLCTSPVNISLNLVVSNLEEVDPKGERISLQVWFRMTWFDYRLQWNSSQHNNLTSLTVEFEEVWTPDMALYSSVGDTVDFGVSTEDGLKIGVIIYSNGDVFFSQPTTIHSACAMNIADFPFDDQTCHMTFGSWTMDSSHLLLQLNNGGLDMSYFIANDKWKVLNISTKTVMQKHASHMAPMSVVVYSIAVRRRALYFLINFIIPPVAISLLSLLLFLIPPEVGKRMEAGINLLLCLSVYLLLVNSKMPSTSTAFPIVTKFYGCAIIILVLTMCCTCLVYALYFMNSSGLEVQDSSVAHCFKSFILRWLEPLFSKCCRCCASESKPRRNQVTPAEKDVIKGDNENGQGKTGQTMKSDKARVSFTDLSNGNLDSSCGTLPRISVVSPQDPECSAQDPGCSPRLTRRHSLDSQTNKDLHASGSLSSFASFRSEHEATVSSNNSFSLQKTVVNVVVNVDLGEGCTTRYDLRQRSKSRSFSDPVVPPTGQRKSDPPRLFLYSEKCQDSCNPEVLVTRNDNNSTWCSRDDSFESHEESSVYDDTVTNLENYDLLAHASEEELQKTENAHQWRRAAKILDRLFITVLLTSIVISFVTCLMLAPRVRQSFIP